MSDWRDHHGNFENFRGLPLAPCANCNGKGLTSETSGPGYRTTVECTVCKGSGKEPMKDGCLFKVGTREAFEL